MNNFSPKDPDEKLVLAFDFTDLFIDSDERIMSVTWTNEVVTGIDTHPENMLTAEVNMFDKTKASHMVSGGVLGVLYKLTCVVITSAQQKFKMSAQIKVQRND